MYVFYSSEHFCPIIQNHRERNLLFLGHGLQKSAEIGITHFHHHINHRVCDLTKQIKLTLLKTLIFHLYYYQDKIVKFFS